MTGDGALSGVWLTMGGSLLMLDVGSAALLLSQPKLKIIDMRTIQTAKIRFNINTTSGSFKRVRDRTIPTIIQHPKDN